MVFWNLCFGWDDSPFSSIVFCMCPVSGKLDFPLGPKVSIFNMTEGKAFHLSAVLPHNRHVH